ncbi:molybdopterin oxidoreductase family protein [Prochlorococcus marinus]|uniref:molybdopterin oxidoreductase family protein n=1 Tax=Prochlorococcus marinus TaxID=1219 RepID=UPI001AD98660|nr:nitrate reductase [Prochlorococcus marinus]MBO8204786.1 nitrate reductase [Prochlorococcus marinus CUG1415]MBW3044069.1 nitrate reductase catalytic subunit [Prochlorococcus marinus str. MU1415]
MNFTKSQCPYCGVGCGLKMRPKSLVSDDKWLVSGDRDSPSTQGKLCVKGATVCETLKDGRLKEPLYRENLNEEFKQISWDESYEILKENILSSIKNYGPDSIAMYGSGQFHTEDYYVAQKLLKGAIGTNNFDANSRLCMSSAVAGYNRSFGSDGPPCCYEDIDHCSLILLIGTNTAECHPVLFDRIKKRKRNVNDNLKVIVIDPRETETSSIADFYLQISSGTDLFLFIGIANYLYKNQLTDQNFINKSTESYFHFVKHIQKWDLKKISEICNISEQTIFDIAKLWGESKNVLSLWSMGLNQRQEGTAAVNGLINLHLMTGQIGKEGSGPFSLTGQPNAMGGREAGGLSHLLPGYRFVKNKIDRNEIEKIWGFPEGKISAKQGLSAFEQIEAIKKGSVKIWWIAATNPLVSMPNLNFVKKALSKCPLIILNESYEQSESIKYAHLVLPAAQWSEKDGVMTNSERRVTLCPSFRESNKNSKPDWQIFAELGQKIGYLKQFEYESSSDVYDEFLKTTTKRLCDMSGLSYQLLKNHGPQQWPYPKGSVPSTSSKRLYEDGHFPTETGKANFCIDDPIGLAEPPSDEYPLILTIGRYLSQWHTMTRTSKVQKLTKKNPEPLLEINSKDALSLKIKNDEIVKIKSKRGEVQAKVQITDKIKAGTVFLPMHWGFSQKNMCEVNSLMHEKSCPISKQPELKACAVIIVPN